MAELRDSLESVKLKNVRTYIQTGNVVCESGIRSEAILSKRIADIVHKDHELSPAVVVRSISEVETAVARCPFAEMDPKTVHFYFLSEEPTQPDLTAIGDLCAATEEFALAGRIFYLHAPDGMARSKLGAAVERLLSVSATARNLHTVGKVIELATA